MSKCASSEKTGVVLLPAPPDGENTDLEPGICRTEAERLLAAKIHWIYIGSAYTWVYVCMYTIYAWTCIHIHEICFSTPFLPVALKESPTAIRGNMHVG